MSSYFTRTPEGRIDGPFSSHELRDRARAGLVGNLDLVRREGERLWVRANKVGGLREILREAVLDERPPIASRPTLPLPSVSPSRESPEDRWSSVISPTEATPGGVHRPGFGGAIDDAADPGADPGHPPNSRASTPRAGFGRPRATGDSSDAPPSVQPHGAELRGSEGTIEPPGQAASGTAAASEDFSEPGSLGPRRQEHELREQDLPEAVSMDAGVAEEAVPEADGFEADGALADRFEVDLLKSDLLEAGLLEADLLEADLLEAYRPPDDPPEDDFVPRPPAGPESEVPDHAHPPADGLADTDLVEATPSDWERDHPIDAGTADGALDDPADFAEPSGESGIAPHDDPWSGMELPPPPANSPGRDARGSLLEGSGLLGLDEPDPPPVPPSAPPPMWGAPPAPPPPPPPPPNRRR